MRGEKTPLVSIIVPIRNSAENLKPFLKSFLSSSYKNFEIIINDDIVSTDNSKVVIEEFIEKGLDIIYIKKNLSMAQGRKVGSEFAKGSIIVHLDSDMQISKKLLIEIVELIESKAYDSLIIPEVSVGYSFWAKVKSLEKKMYQRVPQLESVRVFRKSDYEKLGGHNGLMVFSEDKDLDLRARKLGLKIGRTSSTIIHNEGSIKLFHTLKKKMMYSNTANYFADEHPSEYKWQANPINRYAIFFKNFRHIFNHPLLYFALFYLKTMEYLFSFLGIAFKKLQSARKMIVLIKTIKNWHMVFVDKLGMSNQVVYMTRSGYKFKCRAKSTDINEVVVCMSGSEYPKEYLQLKKGATVIDLGANIGSFSLFLDTILDDYKCYAIEPLPNNAEILRHNIQLNKIENILTSEIAISANDGTVFLNTNIGYDAVHITEDSNGLKVPSQKLSTFCKEKKINSIDLLKIDVEGAEYQIISEALEFISSKVDRIVVEYHEKFKKDGALYLINMLENKFYWKFLIQNNSNGVLLFETRRK